MSGILERRLHINSIAVTGFENGMAEVSDYRRRNRRDVDKVGFMPWRGIALAAAAVAVFAAAMAIEAML